MLVLCNFLRKLVVSDIKIHRAFRIHATLFYKQNPLEKFFIFTIYQNYTLALNDFIENWNESHKIDHKISGIVITQESGDISHTNGNGPVNMNFMKRRCCISEPSDLLMFVLIFMAFPWV